MKIYAADRRGGDKRLIFKEMLSGFRSSSYVGYRLFVKEIKAEYANARFGLLWDFVDPLVFALVFVFLQKSKSIDVGDTVIPYSVFVTCGMLLWQSFVDSLREPISVVQKSKAILTHLNLKPEALIYSVIWRVYFNSAFRIVVMVAVSACLGAFSFAGFLKFLCLFPFITLLGLAMGFCLAPFNVVYGDVSRLVNISIRPLMFISGVIFPLSEKGLSGVVRMWNPMALIIRNLRGLLTTNNFEEPFYFLVISAIFLALGLLGWLLFHATIRFVTERL